jgi:ankyrin repeat protein
MPSLADAIATNNQKALKAAIAAGVDPTVGDGEQPPLHQASALGNLRIMGALLKAGCSLDHRDGRGRTALLVAAAEGRKPAMEKLLKAGADIEVRASDGHTPLHAVAAHGCRDSARLLLRKGASVSARDHLGRTPLHWAARAARGLVAEELRKKGADLDAADHAGDTPLVHALSEALARRVAYWRIDGYTRGVPTSYEIVHGHFTWTKGGTLQPFDWDSQMEAAHQGWASPDHKRYHSALDMVWLLTEKKARVDSVSKDGRTPLHHAALLGEAVPLQRLLDRGADPTVRTPDGDLPLHALARSQRSDGAEVLWAATPEELRQSPNAAGQTPVQVAEASGAPAALVALLRG